MVRTTREGLPAGGRELRERIERWRRTREKRTAMPVELWDEAVRLARGGRAYLIARGVGVDFASLRRRIAEAEASGRRADGAATAGRFVELSGAQILGTPAATGPVVELSDRDGVRLTIRLGGGETLDVAGLVQGFWLCHKRLSRGRFRWWPSSTDTGAAALQVHELQVLLCAGDPSATQAVPIWRRVDAHA